jgi:hypothetical protein
MEGNTGVTGKTSGGIGWGWIIFIGLMVLGIGVAIYKYAVKKKVMGRRMAKARRAIKSGKSGKKTTAARRKKSKPTASKKKRSNNASKKGKMINGKLIKYGSKEWMAYLRRVRDRKKAA